MWPFGRRNAEIEAVPRDTLYAQVVQLTLHQRALGEQLAAAVEATGELRRVDRKLTQLASAVDALTAGLGDDRARLANVIARVDGMRGGRPSHQNREAAEIGERFLAALSSPAGIQQLIQDLQARVPENGGPHGPSPVSIAPPWNPRS